MHPFIAMKTIISSFFVPPPTPTSSNHRFPSPFVTRTVDSVQSIYPTTPLKLEQFALGLHAHPNKSFVSSVLLDISRGADLGFYGKHYSRFTRNAKSSLINPSIITASILKELEHGHRIGSFSSPPFDNFVVNSLGLRAKKNGSLILELMTQLR